MKLNIFFISVLALMPVISDAASARKNIVVTEVGLSKNTNRTFIKSSTLAANSECSDKEHYAMELGTPESYLFYSAALTAMKEGKKMRVQFELDQCLSHAPRVDVFWNLNF